jgi:pimeloyl-ACP methyl ester carboxylesterase
MEVIDSQHWGEGIPLVFFNGFRMHYRSWEGVYRLLEKDHSMLLYNRLGVGGSSKAQCAQTAPAVLATFSALLDRLGVVGPFVLVAHSLGGLFANYYARCHPERLLGLVLVECPHPDEILLQKAVRPPLLLHGFNEAIKRIEKCFDPYKFSEDECVAESLAVVNAAGAFPEVPLAVVTGTKKMPFVPQELFAVHLAHQQKLLALSPYSRQFLCENSGHFPQVTEAAQVVAAVHFVLGVNSDIELP